MQPTSTITFNKKAPTTEPLELSSKNPMSIDRINLFMQKIFSHVEGHSIPLAKFYDAPESLYFINEAKFLVAQIKYGLDLNDGCRRVSLTRSRAQQPGIHDIFLLDLRENEIEMRIFEVIFDRPWEDVCIAAVPNLKFDDFTNLNSELFNSDCLKDWAVGHR